MAGKRGGQVYTIYQERPAKTRKGSPTIIKKGKFQGQLCEYSNRLPVREAVSEGRRLAPEMPEWAEPYTVDGVRFWRNKTTGKCYLPVVLFGDNVASEWYIHGNRVDYKDIEPFLLASEKKHSEPKEGQVPFVVISVEHITRIV